VYFLSEIFEMVYFLFIFQHRYIVHTRHDIIVKKWWSYCTI